MIKAAGVLLASWALFLMTLMLFVLPLLHAHEIYMKFVPPEKRTQDGPDKLKIALCLVCWTIAGTILSYVI